jgi:hypothetical protein
LGWIADNIEPGVSGYLFNIQVVNVKGDIYQRNVIPDLEVNFDQLEEQLEATPEMIAFWDMLLAETKMNVEIIELKIRKLRGEITERMIKDSREAKYEYRYNELRDVITTDKSILQLEIELIRSRWKMNRVKVVVESLSRKFDALRSLSGFKKAEMHNA